VRIDQGLKSGQLPFVYPEVHDGLFNQSVNNWVEAGSFDVERDKSDIGRRLMMFSLGVYIGVCSPPLYTAYSSTTLSVALCG
jgi:hypothetical protein